MASNDARIAGVPITVIGFVAAPVGRIPVATPVGMISCMGLASKRRGRTGAFSASSVSIDCRTAKPSPNHADGLRKYLARFSLTWHDVASP
jgi:hypothetical protein